MATLGKKGIPVTPKVKTSVQTLVRSMEPKSPASRLAAGAPLQTDATATIMFTDIVGSSSMMQHLGDRVGRQVLSKHDEIIRRQIAVHDGLEVKATGDGFMVTFRSATRGVACAIGLQRALAEYGRDHPQSLTPVRIGLSVGEPIHDNKDLFGMSVIMAARITEKTEGGQILISQIAHGLVSSSGDFNLRPVGPVELKGIAGTHPLYEVIWDQGVGLDD